MIRERSHIYISISTSKQYICVNLVSVNLGNHEVAERIHQLEVGGLLGTGPPYDNSKRCKKNPGHVQFVPAAEFSIAHVTEYLQDDLPARITPQDIVDVVRAFVPTTVRVKGHYISSNRPNVWHGVPGAYPFSGHRGTTVSNVGSGWLWRVYEEAPQKWVICVLTAHHVVFGRHDDQTEANKCHVTLFDDGVNKPVTLTFGKYCYGDILRDYSGLEFTTTNAALGKRLRGLCHGRKEIMTRLQGKLRGDRVNQGGPVGGHGVDGDRDSGDDLTCPVIAVQYPHGKQCYVTAGKLKHVKRDGVQNTTVHYTAHSCPGSSGCVILPLGRLDGSGYMRSHPHSGATRIVGVDVSAGWEWRAW